MSHDATSMTRFCARCGTPTEHRVPPDDNRLRDVCPGCGHIHYDNPRLVVGCIATWHQQILLCRRAIEPRRGFWTLPAGFMENGETAADGARRETQEEAGARIVNPIPFALVSIAHIHQVHLFYRAELSSPQYAAGEESLEVALCAAAEIPWQELSFPSVTFALQRFLADREQERFGFHEWSVDSPDAAQHPPPY